MESVDWIASGKRTVIEYKRPSSFSRTRIRKFWQTDAKEGNINALALGSFEELLELLRAHALFGIGAPLDAGRADGAGVQMPALLALGLGLIAPDLDLLATLLAPDILRLGLANLYASWASFFEHGTMLHLCRRNIYDTDHTK